MKRTNKKITKRTYFVRRLVAVVILLITVISALIGTISYATDKLANRDIIGQRTMDWEYVNLRKKPTTPLEEYEILTKIPQGATVNIIRSEVAHNYHTWDEVIYVDNEGQVWRGYVATTSYADVAPSQL